MSKRTESGEHEGTPRWVKVAVVLTALVIVLIVVIVLTGRGGHGPGRHAPASDPAEGHTGPPPGVPHTQP